MKIDTQMPVIREAVVRALTADQIQNREVEFVISSEAVDTYGTVFKIDGWDLERYNRNPVVLYAHRSNSDNPDSVIGTSEVFVEGDKLIGKVRFESAEDNPLAEKVFKKVQNGTLRMASVGANPVRGHWGDEKRSENPDVIYFDEVQLLEWSIVAIGSNPEALKREVQTIEEIRNTIVKDTPEVIETPEPKMLSVREKQLIINSNNK
jgi:HK97 family phage prohead protease